MVEAWTSVRYACMYTTPSDVEMMVVHLTFLALSRASASDNLYGVYPLETLIQTMTSPDCDSEYAELLRGRHFEQGLKNHVSDGLMAR